MADPKRFYNVPGGAPPGSAPFYQQPQTINPNMAGGPAPPTSSFGAPPPSYGGPPAPGNGFSSPNSQGNKSKADHNLLSYFF